MLNTEMILTLNSPSLGCELQPLVVPSIPTLRNDGLLKHLQVTIPNTLTFFQAQAAVDDVPVIAHCNLLNTFGENQWEELRPFTRQIRALKPAHVVEHFTAFRHPSGEKTGIHFSLSLLNQSERRRVIANVRRWQDLLQVPLCLENVPIASNVRTYFDFLLEVREQTGAGIACDLPHFILSAYSERLSEREMIDLAAALAPRQLHVGGLSLSDGILRDNHKLFSSWVHALGRRLFPEAEYITLEQNHQIPADAVIQSLTKMQKVMEECVPPEVVLGGRGLSQDVANDELARDTAKANRYPDTSRGAAYRANFVKKHKTSCQDALDLYDKYIPFLSPLAAIEEAVNDLAPQELVRLAASVSQWSHSYLSWWNPDGAATASSKIAFGTGEKIQFSKRIGNTLESESANIDRAALSKSHRFSAEKGFWVEVASPKISLENSDHNEKKEVPYDARAI